MVGRLLADKGVREYVAAAGMAYRSRPAARFRLLGPMDPNPSAVSEDEVAAWRMRASSNTWAAPMMSDRRSRAHVCVLPSYREGMPRSVLEAMSMGRAVLTTDAPGCRDTVVQGQNGYLVPVKDAPALAARMVEIAGDPARWPAGASSRAMAEERFDVHGSIAHHDHANLA